MNEEYLSIYWDTLDETERCMIAGAPQDEEFLIINQIRLYDVRERRIMTEIKEYQEKKGVLIEEEENNAERDKLTHTMIEAIMKIIQRLENELTRVQRSKTQCISELHKLRKSANEKSSEIADDWVLAALAEEDREGDDDGAETDIVYEED